MGGGRRALPVTNAVNAVRVTDRTFIPPGSKRLMLTRETDPRWRIHAQTEEQCARSCQHGAGGCRIGGERPRRHCRRGVPPYPLPGWFVTRERPSRATARSILTVDSFSGGAAAGAESSRRMPGASTCRPPRRGRALAGEIEAAGAPRSAGASAKLGLGRLRPDGPPRLPPAGPEEDIIGGPGCLRRLCSRELLTSGKDTPSGPLGDCRCCPCCSGWKGCCQEDPPQQLPAGALLDAPSSPRRPVCRAICRTTATPPVPRCWTIWAKAALKTEASQILYLCRAPCSQIALPRRDLRPSGTYELCHIVRGLLETHWHRPRGLRASRSRGALAGSFRSVPAAVATTPRCCRRRRPCWTTC